MFINVYEKITIVSITYFNVIRYTQIIIYILHQDL